MKTTEVLRADHGTAVIKANLTRNEETWVFRPGVEKESELIAGIHSTIPGESPMASGHDRRGRIFTDQRHIYSEEVVSAVRNVEKILLFGSVEAKSELKKILAGDWLHELVEVLESCINTLTDHQMMKVREDFQK
jgi:hypothetical protein